MVNSRIWNETWLSSFFYKPRNYELLVKQSLNMEMAIVMARVCCMNDSIFMNGNTLLVVIASTMVLTLFDEFILLHFEIQGCRNGLDTSS